MPKTGAAARPPVVVEPESLTEIFLIYRKPITIGAIVVAAGIAAGWLWIRSADIRETKAAAAFREAEAIFSAGNQPLALTELEKIGGRYAGTTAGTQADMLRAELLFDQGKFADGIAVLSAAEGGAPEVLMPGLLGLMGGGEEGAKRPAEAAAAYRRAGAAARFESDRDMYRMEEARTLVSAGQAAEARAIYREIAGRDDSPYAGEARIRLGELPASP